MKTWKKIEETKKRTNEISSLKRRNEDKVQKVKIYVENVLDHKFEPDDSHGINHIKHNLEYGYLLIGLIESSRKPRKLY